MNDTNELDRELVDIFRLFFDEQPVSFDIIDTGRSETDFRNAVIVSTAEGNRYVLKLSDNDFTFPEKIAMWKRTAEEYRRLGYYCPAIITDKHGLFPTVGFKGHNCVVYAEEFAPYTPAEDRALENSEESMADPETYRKAVWEMTAKVAGQHFDYTDFPSGYCLFERFCPSDKTDEVLEVALSWKEKADRLPGEFREQTERIWRLWTDNRAELEKVYHELPTSVFKADLNTTNILLDGDGNFVGVYDFNLCGKDVFINYLFRERCNEDFDKEIEAIRETLAVASRYYHFSQTEKDSALMLYRCLKPLWYKGDIDDKADSDTIKSCLDGIEHYLTTDIDFVSCMG